jgi:hypothetical protein
MNARRMAIPGLDHPRFYPARAFDILGAAMTNFTSQLDQALGLSQAIAQAAMAAASAVNSVQRRLAPTAAQAADNAVTAAQGRVAPSS